ncbi:MAG TPA: putative inorganic carbon transporter subunit DabA, partial [Azonexus sp.]|nr:putative inorganic carbon transporter subunit DabA [Azonexus sp.]
MSADHALPIRERLAHWVEHLTHVLPAQAPIRDFVHHNTLHGFQHLPFSEALAAAHRLTGAATYWPEVKFRECYAAGRISRDDLSAAFDEAGLPELEVPVIRALTQRDVLLASLLSAPETPGASRLDWLRREQGLADDPIFALCLTLTATITDKSSPADWQTTAATRWAELCQRVGKDWTLRSLLEYLSGEDVLERVRRILQRQLAAHLDLGVAAWRNPAQGRGFFAAWRASAGLDMFWELDELPNVRDEIIHLIDNPLDVLVEELSRLLPDHSLWYGYLERLSLELPGWSGMLLWRDRHPAFGDGTPVAMLDYL